MSRYVELQVTTNFSFLRGASHPDELVEQAFNYGYKRVAVTDRNTLAGIVRAHDVAKQNDMSIIVGVRLDLLDGPSLLAYPTDKDAYCRLSNLLTKGNLRTEKGKCELYRQDVYEHSKGIKFIVLPPENLNEDFDFEPRFKSDFKEYRETFGRNLYVSGSSLYRGNDAKRLQRISSLSKDHFVPMVATNDVIYHCASRRHLQDVLTCVREKTSIYNAGFLLNANAERFMKSPQEMMRLFKDYPDAIRRTFEIADACRFSLDELKYEYPAEITSDGRTPQQELAHWTRIGAVERFGATIPEKVQNTIKLELEFIEKVNYAPYFLTVFDIVRFARSKGILCQGRGSAANSTVCFCLGITSVNPAKFDLLFERFISSARNEPPDIDVDFESERREEVIQYIYERYGRDRAAIVATVTQLDRKGAIRDVGRAMGLSHDVLNGLSNSIWEYTDERFEESNVQQQGVDINDVHIRKAVNLAEELRGFPRQLGQHTGGFVITNGKLSDFCPLLNARMENRTNIEWNKDDIDALGMLKIDVLGLGMLTCIQKSFELAKQHYGLDLTLANIPQDDPAVYDMICKADTIGVFQIESRAQQSMLPRLKPRCFYDLVIEVAIVRPGPIQGDMVHPYLRRRNGEEPVEYPSDALKEILERTLGIPLFQEQAMRIAMVAAGFTPAEADELRRSMATFKFTGMVAKYQDKLVKGMLERGYTQDFAERIFKQLEGFGSYGFPESHAASFALLVYVSAWLKCHYPDIFGCAILNSQPMGFYHPAQLIIDARNHDVVVKPVDVNHSQWDNTLEEFDGKYRVLRLGFRQVKGVKADDINRLIAARKDGYTDIAGIWHSGVSTACLELLADADAFRSVGMDRRRALWEVTALADRPAVLMAGQENEAISEPLINLPEMTGGQHVVQDYGSMGLSLKAHPVSFVRQKLTALHIVSSKALQNVKSGAAVKISGLVLVRQRPGTAGGVCFMTVEDEFGTYNVIVFKSLFEKYRKEILNSKLLMVEGTLQREGLVVHVIAKKLINLTQLLKDLSATPDDDLPLLTLARADEKEPVGMNVVNRRCQVREKGVDINFPPARNFK